MKKLKLKHHFKKLRCPFAIYADFECLTEELEKPEDDEIKTYKYQEHKPCGFMLNLVNAVDNTNKNFCIGELMLLMCFVKRLMK